MATRRTNPNHKATFTIGVRCECSCGWGSSLWLNKGAKAEAAKEWRRHREHCELVASISDREANAGDTA